NEKIYEDKNKRSEHHQTLHHGIIPLADRFDEEFTDAVEIEDLLGDHQTSDEESEFEPYHRDDRQERVFERMANEDRSLPEPLGARGANVVFTQHFQHRR